MQEREITVTELKEKTEAMIHKVAFVYLKMENTSYCLTDDMGYRALRRPQLGLQYMCAVLEKQGIQTNIFDQSVSDFDFEWLCKQLKGYDLVGFSCSDAQEGKVKTYATQLKEKLGIHVIVGGPSTLGNSSFVDYGCDFVIHGEAERTIQQIVEFYNGERELEDIKGVSYKKDEELVLAPPQEQIKNLDELPFPERSKVDINAYYDYFIFGMRKPYITMTASRGCIYRCSYCSSPSIWSFKDRQRSVDNVIAELDDVVPKYGIKYIAFQDDIFGITPQWIEEFCTKLIAKPYKVRWMGIIHPLTLKGDAKEVERLVRLMRKAGCDTLSFGLQTADPQILKNINRLPQEPERLKMILSITNKLNIVTNVGFIFGLPGDTKESLQRTTNFIMSCDATLVNIYALAILKGSEMEKQFASVEEACTMPQNEVLRLTQDVSKRFYSRPKTLARIAYLIMRNNPAWPFRVSVTCLPSILARIGFVRTKKTTA